STAWIVIRSYYAAFFAAHSILRMLGLTISQLEAGHLRSIEHVALLYGASIVRQMEPGSYQCVYDPAARTLLCTRVRLRPHDALWRLFYDTLGKLTAAVLSRSKASASGQLVVAKLDELQGCLRGGKATTVGNWLAQIRNRANYRQEFGIWFPYSAREPYYER